MAIQPLYGLAPSVRHLGLHGLTIGRQRLRLRDLASVQSVAIDWGLLDVVAGFGSALESVSITGYRPRDLGDLLVEGPERIEHLSLVQARALEDLTALEALPRLRSLSLYGCPKLVDLSPLAALGGLRHLALESCRKIETVAGALPPDLATLELTDCGTIDSVASLAERPTLERVALNGDTRVSDKDLSPLLRLPRLHSVLVASVRGYVPPAKELRERFG